VGGLADRRLIKVETLTMAVGVSAVSMALVAMRLWRLLARAQRLEARRGEERLSALIHHSTDAIFLVGVDASIRFASPAAHELLATATAADASVSLIDAFVHDDRQALASQLASLAAMPLGAVVPLEGRVAGNDGLVLVFEGTGANLLGDDNVGSLVVTLRDTTSRRELEEQLQRRVFCDDLTGIANRALFADRVAHALDRSTRQLDIRVAVMFVDLDDFKAVNDGLGHGAGDQLLRAVAVRIRACLRPADTVARMGGDEFAILVEDVPTVDYARNVAQRILEVLRLPVDVAEVSLAVPASIGIALAADSSTVESLLRDADIAMYSAKAQGKGRVAVFDDALRESAVQRLQFKVELPAALNAGQLRLDYQPILDISSQALRGFEALLRWDHPERGLIPPVEFIPAAEETGAIVDIGRWVLEEACRQAVLWNDNDSRSLWMSVNVSAVQLYHPGFVADVRRVLQATGLPAALLTLELTESVLIVHDRAEAILAELRAVGVGIAIDDFGTGYSSLAYLQRFPISSFKVDRSFISQLNETGDSGLVRSILAMAEAFGLTTVAEGIETTHQLSALDDLGCNLGQGFYLGRPQSAAEIDRLLRHEPRADLQAADGSLSR
jgi:diguanylate cyclase (GGDEF)-like protein/PAS domain S-box-containing protein